MLDPGSAPPVLSQRRYFLSRSACHMYFLSGNLSGILILRKSSMHFSSSSSTVSFSFTGRFLQLVSRELAVSVRSRSLFRRCSDCWGMATGPFFCGLSRVWTWVWGCDWRLTGPQMTVPCGEPASDWLSELEVERSLKEVPLSPSPLWFLQQQSHGGEDQRDGPPERRQTQRWMWGTWTSAWSPPTCCFFVLFFSLQDETRHGPKEGHRWGEKPIRGGDGEETVNNAT